MLYELGQKFLVQGVLTEVRYINQGYAWVFLTEDTPAEHGRSHLACVHFEKLDAKGIDTKGNRAKSVNNKRSLAV